MTETIRQLQAVERTSLESVRGSSWGAPRAVPAPAPSPPPPVPEVVHERRRFGHVIARALTILGVLSILFSVFQWRISDISEARAQRSLRGAFADLIASGTGLGFDTNGKPVGIRAGSPVALLKLPTLDVTKIVVEGTGAEELKRGPGHVPTSPLPGQSGHAILAGRRATFGSPFADIGRLARGDPIETVTPLGRSTYRVRESRTVTTGEATKLAEAPGSLLTLLTSQPGSQGDRALAVVAALDGAPSSFADPPRPAAQREGIVGIAPNAGALPFAAASGVALTAVLAITGELYRRWRRWPTYLLTTPVILSLLFVWVQAVASLLPATL